MRTSNCASPCPLTSCSQAGRRLFTQRRGLASCPIFGTVPTFSVVPTAAGTLLLLLLAARRRCSGRRCSGRRCIGGLRHRHVAGKLRRAGPFRRHRQAEDLQAAQPLRGCLHEGVQLPERPRLNLCHTDAGVVASIGRVRRCWTCVTQTQVSQQVSGGGGVGEGGRGCAL